ncbi:unnamed protein product [Leuciscus chuanchicus]
MYQIQEYLDSRNDTLNHAVSEFGVSENDTIDSTEIQYKGTSYKKGDFLVLNNDESMEFGELVIILVKDNATVYFLMDTHKSDHLPKYHLYSVTQQKVSKHILVETLQSLGIETHDDFRFVVSLEAHTSPEAGCCMESEMPGPGKWFFKPCYLTRTFHVRAVSVANFNVVVQLLSEPRSLFSRLIPDSMGRVPRGFDAGFGERVWIMGDSYIRRGEQHARMTIGTNLGVPAQVQWFGRGGLCWEDLLPFFQRSLKGRSAPDVLVVHCGGNDLGHVKSVLLLK